MTKNDGGVNYIRHLLSISEKFIDDERLSPLHISLYYALFQSWNLSKFRNPISINREEMMRASKIGSANTYTKCLKELDTWEYIKYYPSFNPHKGSQIYLYNFNKPIDNAIDISTDKSYNKTSEKGANKTSVKALIPSINSLNKTNKLNNKKKHVHKSRKDNRESLVVTDNGFKRKKVASKKEKQPTMQEIKNYFTECKWPEVEAEKFYNYFESNGWLVGGKTPMQNWKAATRNWMLNSEKFSNGKTNSTINKTANSAGKLHTNGNKDYSEPL